jgi:hypothetical protein
VIELRIVSGLSGLSRSRTVLVLAPARCVSRGQGAAAVRGPRAERVRAARREHQARRLGLRRVEPDPGAAGEDRRRRAARRRLAPQLPARPEPAFKLASGAQLGNGDAIVVVVEDHHHLLPLLNAIGRAFPRFSRKSKPSDRGAVTVVAVDPRGRPLPAVPATVRTVSLARDAARLVDTPPTEMNPAVLAKEAKALLRHAGRVRLREVVGGALAKRGLHGIHSSGARRSCRRGC